MFSEKQEVSEEPGEMGAKNFRFFGSKGQDCLLIGKTDRIVRFEAFPKCLSFASSRFDI